MRKILLFLAICFFPFAVFPMAGGKETVILWPEGAPGALGSRPSDQPSLDIHPAPDRIRTSTAVVVCPGGGYRHLAMDHEGSQVAEWLNSMGVTALVLKYRLAPDYGHPAPMHDVQQALRWTRSHAGDLAVRPDRIGIIGFSAGGHLASVSGTHAAEADADSADPLRQVSSRPDFMILVYPVISLSADWTHQGSKTSLLGGNPDPELVRLMSSELQVSEQTPPAFLVLSDEDRAVPAENSIFFYLALRRAGIPAELHVYRRGPHGFGLAPLDATLSTWPQLCRNWLIDNNFLD